MNFTLNPDELPSVTFACGPGQGHPVLRQTPLYKTLFERSHRAADISTEGLYRHATENLRELLKLPPDYTVLFFAGGATNAMDAVMWSLVKNSVSGPAFGAFSNRWGEQIAARLEPGVLRTICKAKAGEWFPQQKPDLHASLVFLTPNETSTGVQIPDDYLLDVWKNKGEDTLVAWDATSCAGGRNLPQNKFDVLVFALQKCFGAGGGTSVIVLSPAAVERAKEGQKYRTVPYSLDLNLALEQARKFQTFNTPNTTNIWLFNRACQWMNENGGIQAMDALCRAHAGFLVRWAEKSNYLAPLVKDENFRSYTTLTLKITDPKIQAEDISAALAATGRPNLADGLKKHPYVKEKSLRVSCFPFVDIHGTGEYEKLAKTVDAVVRQLRHS